MERADNYKPTRFIGGWPLLSKYSLEELQSRTKDSESPPKPVETAKRHKEYSDLIITSRGNVYWWEPGKKLEELKKAEEYVDSEGYRKVKLWPHHPRSKKWERVYRLVAQTFLHNPNYKVYHHIHHIDNNESNDCVSNLMWVTQEQHSEIHGFYIPSNKS